MKLCTPLVVYLILAGISLAYEWIQRPGYHGYSLTILLTHLVFIGLWSLLIYWLCSKNFLTVAWTIVLLPFIILVGTFFIFIITNLLRGF